MFYVLFLFIVMFCQVCELVFCSHVSLLVNWLFSKPCFPCCMFLCFYSPCFAYVLFVYWLFSKPCFLVVCFLYFIVMFAYVLFVNWLFSKPCFVLYVLFFVFFYFCKELLTL